MSSVGLKNISWKFQTIIRL